MEGDEEKAKSEAIKQAINILQRPGQLEKIAIFKKRVDNKLTSLEALLKTALQSQLDGVRVGLNQLNQAVTGVDEIRTDIQQTGTQLASLDELWESLQDIREENLRYSQYATAMENLKHIFNVPESVEKTRKWIGEGKLLHAHQCLSDLENSRNDLLLELHKSPSQSTHDKIMLKQYFEDVVKLSDMLEKQIRLILDRTLNTLRKEPTVLVTALRIIEREECYDQEAFKLQKQTGFLPPGRPKKWRDMAFTVLENAAQTRIEGTQIDEREDNKMWLVRHLELIRQMIIEDLRVVATLGASCFPPSYNIVYRFVHMYHNCLSKHIHELIESGLHGNEYVSLLSWVLNTYAKLLEVPELNLSSINDVEALLDEKTIVKLQKEYLKNVEQNYNEWMQNTLIAEQQEWQSNNQPEQVGADGCYRSSAPVIIFQMIDQNLQVTKTISQELTDQALLLSMDHVIKYGQSYHGYIVEFKNRHFEDRSKMPFYTHHMISIINSCLHVIELSQQLRQYWSPNVSDLLSVRFENISTNYINLRNEAASFLLEEAFLDLDKHFDELFTSAWLNSSLAVDTICVTLEDYFQDYNYLTETNFEYVINDAQQLVVKRYVTAMLQKRVQFKNVDECLVGAEKIAKEEQQLKSLFARVAPSMADQVDEQFDIVKMLAEVLKCHDSEMISLDLHNLVDKFPDITEDHLVRLLYLRGDLGRGQAKEKVSFVLENRRQSGVGGSGGSSIFKSIVFADKILSW